MGKIGDASLTSTVSHVSIYDPLENIHSGFKVRANCRSV